MKVTIELNGFDEIDEAATLLAAMRDGREAVQQFSMRLRRALSHGAHRRSGSQVPHCDAFFV
jgi:hypothetical protein